MGDVKGIKRVIRAFNKIPDEDGNQLMVVEYDLKPVVIKWLQKLFNINPKDPDPGVRDIIDCYNINLEQAQALQAYVIDGKIDLNKYVYLLACYADEDF